MTRILFFGRLRDAAGCSELVCQLPGSVRSLRDVREWLGTRDPALGEALSATGVRMAVDRAFCGIEADVHASVREIAFMSPLSGG